MSSDRGSAGFGAGRGAGGEGVLPTPISTFGAASEVLVRAVLQPPESLRALGRLDDYEVLELVGGGGMGYVFRARRRGSDEEVAIKVLRPELVFEAAVVRRFLREAEHMERLRHPHVLSVHRAVARAEGPYFVMDLVRTGSLARLLGEGKALARDRALGIARQVADALVHAHAHGILHRDLKPGNVLINPAGDAFLTDFGLARTLVGDSVGGIEPAGMAGTAPYMSPALAEGRAEDTRGDIYGFGALLFEMLTGQPPYTGETVEAVRRQIRAGPPPAIRVLNPEADPDLAAIAERAMARRLRDRYASMEDVVTDLERVAAGSNLQESPGTPGQAGYARVRRLSWWDEVGWKRVRGRAATMLGLGLLGVVGYQWWNGVGRESRLRLEHAFQVPGLWELDHAQLATCEVRDEVVLVVAQDNRVFQISLTGEVWQSYPLPDPQAGSARLGLLTAGMTDAGVEQVVSWVSGTTLRGSVFGWDGAQRQRFEIAGWPAPEDPSTTRSRWVLERGVALVPGGNDQLLGWVDHPDAAGWRGVVSFDRATGQLLWQVPTAGRVVSLVSMDVDGDGTLEVLVGTSAAEVDPASPDGVQTGEAVLLCIDAVGQVKWQWTGNGGMFSVQPVEISPGKAQPAGLWAWATAPADASTIEGFSGVGMIAELAGDGTMRRMRSFPVELVSCLAADLDGDEIAELLVTDRLGFVHVLDATLEVRQSVRVLQPRQEHARVRLWTVADLNGNGRPEIVLDAADGVSAGSGPVVYHEGQLLILDDRLRVRGRQPLAALTGTVRGSPRAEVRNIDENPALEIVYFWPDRVQVYGYR